MAQQVVLASGSATRAAMLRQAGVAFQVQPAPIDEVALRQSLAAEGIGPRDQSDALAEMKAQRISMKQPEALVIGSDQILALGTQVFGKSDSRAAARDTLTQLRGQRHSLFSAAVIYEGGKPIWRHVSEVRLQMRPISDTYLDAYLDRNWPDVAGSVGGYHIEGEGIRLFSTISGDYFAILGMPLLPLLAFLTTKGVIDG